MAYRPIKVWAYKSGKHDNGVSKKHHSKKQKASSSNDKHNNIECGPNVVINKTRMTNVPVMTTFNPVR